MPEEQSLQQLLNQRDQYHQREEWDELIAVCPRIIGHRNVTNPIKAETFFLRGLAYTETDNHEKTKAEYDYKRCSNRRPSLTSTKRFT